MIYTKDGRNFIVSCECGCGEALSFSIDHDLYEDFGDYCYITPVSYGTNKDMTSIWYNIKETATNIVDLLMGKNVYRVGVCLTQADVDYMIKWFKKEITSAKKYTTIPNHESLESIFNNKRIEYRSGEEIYIKFDRDMSGNIVGEFCLYSTREHNYKIRQTIKQLFREFRRNKMMCPNITLSRISFIHFCEHMIEVLEKEE